MNWNGCGRNRDSSVGIATGYELNGPGSIPSRDKIISLPHSVQTGSVTNPASYPISKGGSFLGVKAAGA
jgi:hypothetical protein